jgi:cytochrome P450
LIEFGDFHRQLERFGRTITQDIEYSGIRIPAGDSLYFMVGATNRDPGQFANPDKFVPARQHNRHVAFGGDAHVCLGSTLARLEGQIALRGLVRRFPRLELRMEQPECPQVSGSARYEAFRSILMSD